jgi:hypothetical protein
MSPKKEILQTKPIKTSREISYEQNWFLFFSFGKVVGRKKGCGWDLLIDPDLCEGKENELNQICSNR